MSARSRGVSSIRPAEYSLDVDTRVRATSDFSRMLVSLDYQAEKMAEWLNINVICTIRIINSAAVQVS